MEKVNHNSPLSVVNFSTRDFHGSIDINSLLKVISLPNIEPTPTGPAYMVGLINLAGQVVPIIDLSMRMNMSMPERYTIDTPIIICKRKDGRLFGMIVESIIGITDVDQAFIEYDANTKYHGLVTAAIRYEDHISLLINTDELLGTESLYDLQYDGDKE